MVLGSVVVYLVERGGMINQSCSVMVLVDTRAMYTGVQKFLYTMSFTIKITYDGLILS